MEALLVSTSVVALAEMGDKTRLATVALAARYDPLVAVVVGTTLGMMIANVPAVWMGEALAHRVNVRWMRWVAAALFVVLGGLTFLAGDDAVRLPRAPATRDAVPGR
jgi:Ca2+/H+ antiporter, TMEM165/GDT1 family